MNEIGKVHGTHHTYYIMEKPGLIQSTKYFVKRSDGKTWGSYSSRAAAYEAAHEKAGKGSREGR